MRTPGDGADKSCNHKFKDVDCTNLAEVELVWILHVCINFIIGVKQSMNMMYASLA